MQQSSWTLRHHYRSSPLFAGKIQSVPSMPEPGPPAFSLTSISLKSQPVECSLAAVETLFMSPNPVGSPTPSGMPVTTPSVASDSRNHHAHFLQRSAGLERSASAMTQRNLLKMQLKLVAFCSNAVNNVYVRFLVSREASTSSGYIPPAEILPRSSSMP